MSPELEDYLWVINKEWDKSFNFFELEKSVYIDKDKNINEDKN